MTPSSQFFCIQVSLYIYIYYTNYTFIHRYTRCLTRSAHMTPEPTSDASKKSRVCENAIAHNTTTTINY